MGFREGSLFLRGNYVLCFNYVSAGAVEVNSFPIERCGDSFSGCGSNTQPSD